MRRLRDHPWVLTPLIFALRIFRRMGLFRDEQIYRHFPYRGTVQVAVPGGGAFRVDSSGCQIENGLYWDGLYAHEPASMQSWVQLSQTARSVLDIGANSGVFALAAAAAGARDVHAFEPVPRVHDILARNLELNGFGNLHAWQLAVADKGGVAELYDPGGDAPTSASLSHQFSREHFGETASFKVSVVSVDEFCAMHGIEHVDLIKLDVEGHEEFALTGMRETVLRDRPAVLMEVLEGYESRLRDAVLELFGQGWEWTRIKEGNGTPDRNVLLIFTGGATPP